MELIFGVIESAKQNLGYVLLVPTWRPLHTNRSILLVESSLIWNDARFVELAGKVNTEMPDYG